MLFFERNTLAGKTYLGWFAVEPDQVLVGELNMEEPRHPVLILFNPTQTRWKNVQTVSATVRGQLTDNARVNLSGGTIPNSEHTIAKHDVLQRQVLTGIPYFVISGNQHLNAE